MSRKPFIAGNWKMNKNPEEAKAFVEAVAAKLPSSDLVEAGISMKQTKTSTKKRMLSSAMVWCQSSAVVNRLKLTKLVKL